MTPSSALRQSLHTTSMRPLARLEDEALSYTIRIDYFLPVPLSFFLLRSQVVVGGCMNSVKRSPVLRLRAIRPGFT